MIWDWATLAVGKQFHAVCVLVAGDGERDGRHAVFRVVGITENRLNHHLCFPPIR